MANDNLETSLDEALAGLKDFQRKTVDTVYNRLFRENQKSMLVADEVGLGKTVVAKGLIAMALQERLRAGVREPFKVTYICSNQVIAGENVGKLNVFPDVDLAAGMVRRIAYLAYAPPEDKTQFSRRMVLNTLTPGTSFNIVGGTGTRQERGIIYTLLCSDPEMDVHRNALACLLRGGVQIPTERLREWMQSQRSTPLREGLGDSFISLLRNRTLKPEMAPRTRELLGVPFDRRPSVYEAVHDLAEILRSNNEANHRRACNEMCGILREILIKACLKYVDADLFILDEFQRFRNLVDQDCQEDDAVIARKVFEHPRARILLLSATPFKALTDEIDESNGDDHHKDFGVILKFLTKGDQEFMDGYERHRRELFRQLLNLQKGDLNLDTTHRDEIQRLLRSVMCRTERQRVASDPDAMILDKWRKAPLAFHECDVRNYRATDSIAMALDKAYEGKRHAIGQPVEYCKSSPHPLSYLDGYALKHLLKASRRNENIRSVLKQNPEAWLDLHRLNRYRLTVSQGGDEAAKLSCAHARLAKLAEEAIGANGAKLLWIPPSMPYYQLGGAYKDSLGFSKVLVFSGWVMVPRMIASLLSYEVERVTIGDPSTQDAREGRTRRYFPPPDILNYKRHPVPLLVFRGEEKAGSSAKGMSNFCCLYPCISLARVYSPLGEASQGLPLAELKDRLVKRITDLIETSDLRKYEHRDGSSEKWYWAAPALLDHADPALRRTVSYWLHDEKLWDASKAFRPAAAGREESNKRAHVRMFRDAFLSPETLELGRMPRDLPEFLADMVLGSPAVVSLRSLLQLFPGDRKPVESQHLSGAFDIADEFLNLFNKPESICAVRLSTKADDYWRQVLRYCADGCLQAVIDEYGHLLKGQKTKMKSTVEHLANTITITAASINVDSHTTFMKGRPQRMRCHYAVDFGNQKLETEEGQSRATSIRENFNSPFRPFVLATTSIGQEGLDFHQYCRKIVHWNLPGNPIDLEQREGRINRFKGLVIRQALARRYADRVTTAPTGGDLWQTLFEIADREERVNRGKCELVPYWHVDTDAVKIERIIPMYPFSRDQGKLNKILRTLAIYRLTFGQPRQVELIEHLLAKDFSPEEIDLIRSKLLINLSPISYGGVV